LRRYGSLELTTWAMVLGALMALPLAPGLPAAIGDAGAEPLAAVLFLGVGASAIGFVTWAYACALVDVSLAAACLYTVPVVAFGLGWLWLGEEPAPFALIGGAVALAGVALATRAGARSRAAAAAPSLRASRA
jgi:drug/metabolite transporter (DMT)-like permease